MLPGSGTKHASGFFGSTFNECVILRSEYVPSFPDNWGLFSVLKLTCDGLDIRGASWSYVLILFNAPIALSLLLRPRTSPFFKWKIWNLRNMFSQKGPKFAWTVDFQPPHQGPSIMLNAHPSLPMRLPGNTPIVLAHGSNDEASAGEAQFVWKQRCSYRKRLVEQLVNKGLMMFHACLEINIPKPS